MTVSEELFDRYCTMLGYGVEVIPTQPRATAARVRETAAGPVGEPLDVLLCNNDRSLMNSVVVRLAPLRGRV